MRPVSRPQRRVHLDDPVGAVAHEGGGRGGERELDALTQRRRTAAIEPGRFEEVAGEAALPRARATAAGAFVVADAGPSTIPSGGSPAPVTRPSARGRGEGRGTRPGGPAGAA